MQFSVTGLVVKSPATRCEVTRANEAASSGKYVRVTDISQRYISGSCDGAVLVDLVLEFIRDPRDSPIQSGRLHASLIALGDVGPIMKARFSGALLGRVTRGSVVLIIVANAYYTASASCKWELYVRAKSTIRFEKYGGCESLFTAWKLESYCILEAVSGMSHNTSFDIKSCWHSYAQTLMAEFSETGVTFGPHFFAQDVIFPGSRNTIVRTFRCNSPTFFQIVVSDRQRYGRRRICRACRKELFILHGLMQLTRYLPLQKLWLLY